MLTLKIIVKRSYAVKPRDLLKAREKAGLSQAELAVKLDLLGWSQESISRIEGQFLPHYLDKDTIEQFQKAGFAIEYI